MKQPTPYITLFKLLTPKITELAKRGDAFSLRKQVALLNRKLPNPVPHISVPTQDIVGWIEASPKIIDLYIESTFIEICYCKDPGTRDAVVQELDEVIGEILKQKQIAIQEMEELAKFKDPAERDSEEYRALFQKKISFINFFSECNHAFPSFFSTLKKEVQSIDLKAYQNITRFLQDQPKEQHPSFQGGSFTVLGAATQQNDPEILFHALVSGTPYQKVDDDGVADINRIQILRQFIHRTRLSYEDAMHAFESVKKLDGEFFKPSYFVLIDLLIAYQSMGHDIKDKLNDIRKQCFDTMSGRYCGTRFDKRSEAFRKLSQGEIAPIEMERDGRFHNELRTLDLIKTFLQYHKLEIPPKYFFSPIERSTAIPAMGLFMMALNEKDPSFPSLFLQLMEKFHRVSSLPTVDETQKRSVEKFFPEYYKKIFLLSEIMGASAFKWMSDQLAQTVLPLERLLTNLPDNLPDKVVQLLKEYFEKNALLIMQRDNLKSWQNTLIGIGAQCEIAKDLNREVDIDSIRASLIGEPQAISSKINHALMRTVLNLMEIPAEIMDRINIEAVLNKVTSHQFTLLIREKLSMKNSKNPFTSILDGLITRFLTQQNVDEYLHAANSQIGRHNQKIQEKLRAAGIDPNTALHYDRKFEFSIGGERATQHQKLTASEAALMTHLDKLKEKISDVLPLVKEDKVKSQLESINGSLAIVQKEKGSKKEKSDHIDKIKKNCDALLKNPVMQAESFRELREFAQHVVEQYDSIQKLKSTSFSGAAAAAASGASKKSETFVIEQWDKTRFETLFLGNEVECCLAVGSAQFPAILQRTMDDAMLFHVVTEKASGKPVALSWLYLAEDKDGKIYVVANFLEIKARYGVEEASRKAIIDELLRFTGEQYCRDNPKIAGFLINELGYGWGKGKLSDLPVREIALVDKVGGALLPSEHAECDDAEPASRRTASVYYLASLDRSKLTFHEYPSYRLKHAAAAAAHGIFAGSEKKETGPTHRPNHTISQKW